MNSNKSRKYIEPIGNIVFKKNNDIILKNTIIKDLRDFINMLNEFMIFNNQYISIQRLPKR